ncbi:ABC transporter substrate-binding protein [Streptomyces sp. NPDC048182]|uniref:ABC transporter substrate-binding protein n=1 Tax=Streptomyces sp. NPDC048182 TaxID=3365507 RepID=UPI003719FDB2
MTETIGSFVGEAYGSVHSGDGNQYNFYFEKAAHWLRSEARKRPRSIAEQDRRHLAERFVPPPGLQRARARLHVERTVLVDGLSGSGRRAAALMLLHELPAGEGTLHELPDTSDDDTGPALDARYIGRDDRLLLDLSETDEARYLAVQNALSDFRSAVVARDAHLVVIGPHHLNYLLREELRHLTTELGRPGAGRVLAVHLKCAGIQPDEAALGGTELAGFLTRAPLRDVAALADRIRRFRDTSSADRGLADWLRRSLEDQHDQSGRVAADFAAAHSGRHRALQLAVAMFHGATPDMVLQAANALLELLSHPPDPTPRLDQADLAAELAAVQAAGDPDGRVRFTIAGYGRAVRQHFWTFLPDIRRQLRDWLMRQAADPALDPEVRRVAVGHFVQQTLRVAHPEDLAWVVERWTSSGAPARLIPEAARVLALGLDNEHHGRFFRQRVYDWATSADTSVHCSRVLVMVCEQTMAGSHPDQALVRLHHLARGRDDGVRSAARQAVLRLTACDDRLYQLMLKRLETGITYRLSAADLGLFVELADPGRLLGRHSVRASLAACWAGVLRGRADWTTLVGLWLDAGRTGRGRDLVADVLVTACARDPRLLGRLYRVTRDWLGLRPDADRTDMVSRLLRTINAAQGLEDYDRTG